MKVNVKKSSKNSDGGFCSAVPDSGRVSLRGGAFFSRGLHPGGGLRQGLCPFPNDCKLDRGYKTDVKNTIRLRFDSHSTPIRVQFDMLPLFDDSRFRPICVQAAALWPK